MKLDTTYLADMVGREQVSIPEILKMSAIDQFLRHHSVGFDMQRLAPHIQAYVGDWEAIQQASPSDFIERPWQLMMSSHLVQKPRDVLQRAILMELRQTRASVVRMQQESFSLWAKDVHEQAYKLERGDTLRNEAANDVVYETINTGVKKTMRGMGLMNESTFHALTPGEQPSGEIRAIQRAVAMVTFETAERLGALILFPKELRDVVDRKLSD